MKGFIIKSKFLLPNPPSFAICRKRIERKISEGLKKNFLFIVGSSGSGKTTAISLYLEKHKPGNVIYIRLTPEDANFAIFTQYIAKGFELIGIDMSEITNFAEKPPKPYILSAYVINKVEDFKEDIYLILDDFHNVENKYVLNFINPIFNNKVPNFHLVLLSQKKPSMKIGKEILKGNAVLIREKELYFSREEIATVTQSIGLNLSKTNIERIYKRTEGWPIGVVASMKLYAKGINEFKKSYNEMFREILKSQDKKTRNLLIKISPLAEASPSILKGYLTDEEINILMELPDKGAFCYRTEHGFRLQNLFREFLLSEFEKLPDKEKYLKKLGKKFEGYDAVHSLVFYLKAKDFESAANLIRNTNFLPLGIIGFQTAKDLLDEVPPGYLVKLPEVALLKGEVSLRVGDVKVAASITDRILETESPEKIRFKAYVLKISALTFQGRYAEAAEFIKNAEKIAEKLNFSETVDFYYLAARIYYLTGHFEDSKKVVKILIANLDSVKNPLNRAKILNSYCIVNLAREGKFRETVDFYEDIISMLHSYNLNADPRYYINMAMAYMELGELESSENTLQTALDVAKKLSWKERIPDIRVEAGFLALMENDPDKAERLFEKVEKSKHISKFLQASYNMGMSILMRKRKNFGKALEYANEDLKITKGMGKGALLGESLLNIAKIHTAAGDFEIAKKYLEEAEPLLAKGHDYAVLVNLNLVKGIISGENIKKITDEINKKGYRGILFSDSDIVERYLNGVEADLQVKVSISTLGSFKVFVENEEIPYKSFRRKGILNFFKYLTVHYPKKVSIDKIADDLYRHLDFKKAKHNIYVAVSVINKLFESYGIKEIIIRSQGMYGLNPVLIKNVDFVKFIELVKRKKYGEAVMLYKGSFLEENAYDEWAIPLRDRLIGMYVEALSELAKSRSGKEREEALKKLLDVDPLNEEAAEELFKIYSETGNKSSANMLYNRLKEIYNKEYGMDLPESINRFFKK